MRRAAASLLALALALAAAPAGAQQVLVDFGSPMRYLANSADPALGVDWTAETFDDSSWAVGSYGVGYEDATGAEALLRTLVPVNTQSIYTRAAFTIGDPAALTGLALGVDYDDAVAAWINGVEVWRSPEMPAGTPAWNTNPELHECSNAASPVFTPLRDVSARGIPALRAGDNILAVAVWNGSLPSSDLVLVPRLVADAPPAVSRGPYLQLATPDSVIVRWRTLSLTDSVVRWGDTPASLPNEARDPTLTTEHELRLTGLQPGTRYHYAVGMTGRDLAGGDASHAFTTPPAPGATTPVRAWIVGDSGTANADARRVRDAWRARQGGRAPDLWLMLGDNAYTHGTDSQYQAAVFDTYAAELRQSVVWPTLGNHDALSASAATGAGVYFDAFTLPARGECGGVPSGTEAYWSFDWANVHFACLDSQESDRSPAGAMADWLRRDLAATTQDWLVVYFHHPPYTKGSHDSDTEIRHVEMREWVLPLLEDAGVDLVLSGHSHSYERSILLDGHHGDSTTFGAAHVVDGGDGSETGDGAYVKARPRLTPHSGEVCVVAGSSGKTDTGPLDHPAMHVALEVLGSFVLDVAGDRLDGTFLDDQGVVRDAFTMIKQRPAEDCSNGLDDDLDGRVDCEDTDCPAPDADADGTPDCADCAPADSGVAALPAEIALLRAAKPLAGDPSARLAWDDPRPDAGSATVADVATGSLLELLADRGLDRAACLARDVAGTSRDVPGRPATGAEWYVVRARNSCGASSWGPAASLAGCP